ncbi:TonB-dependent outer membrane receptor, SusC/RagA subfamily, signature region [Hymenobacter daecheongensis DSM 21074]|uniref:TonB-dependent outer membrane receptor, SusC/RagA subfamily, signature region n=1 Tax=Hymenobacter daecheongensis DSM 21074 TaxID=1121955 RepID=A0A1M6AU61_9BACT|nr:M56 family metallopeptidase [Hymenobacter daecheongensis]SHI39753.1 TonB-dependent outer membrane receptor, SusC/RagA subfamily, signature region [Hymenobacter daecheongensis DSM 21074]
MSALLLYLLKANVALTLFWAVYWLGLRRLTFYTLNRWFLLLAIGFAALYPLVPLGWLNRPEAPLGAAVYHLVPDWQALARPAPAAAFDWGYWLELAYWAGVVALLLRLAAQFGALYRLHRSSRAAWLGRQPFRRVAEAVNPFSFWQSIYLNPNQHSAAELPAILEHEQVHVRQWHTLDVLLAQVQQAFYWFNPGAWLLRRAVLENLEFITDRAVLRAGLLDSKAYQYSLVRLSTLAPGSALANHFTFLILKNRIMMMNKPQSSHLHLAKYALVLPLAAVVMAFTTARPAAPAAAAPPKAVAATGEKLYFVDGQPVSKAVVDKLDPNTLESMNVLSGPAATEAFGSSAAAGVVIITTKKNKDSAAVKAFNAKHHITYAPADPKAMARQLAGKLIILDGQEITAEQLQNLPPDQIQAMSVYKDEDAVRKFGEKGRKGVIEVKTKPQKGGPTGLVPPQFMKTLPFGAC